MSELSDATDILVTTVSISKHRRLCIYLVPARNGRLNGATLRLEQRGGDDSDWLRRFDLSCPINVLPELIDSLLDCEKEAVALGWLTGDPEREPG